MTALAGERTELRHFSEDELADLYAAGDDSSRAQVLAELGQREQAKSKGQQARQAAQAAWYDAAHAAMLQAERDCRGVLFSAYGREHGPADAMGLWSGPERQARRWASEELGLWWDTHGRLTVSEYLRQAADAKRQEREERQPAKPGKPARKRAAWIGVPGGAVCEMPVRLGQVTVTAWAAMGHGSDEMTTHPDRAAAERYLSPPAPAPLPAPVLPPRPARSTPVAPGAIGRYTGALAALTNRVDGMTARVLATRARIERTRR